MTEAARADASTDDTLDAGADEGLDVGPDDHATAAAVAPSATPVTGTTGRDGSRGMALANRLGLGLAAALVLVAGALGLWASSLNGQLQDRDEQAQQVAAVLASDGARTIQLDGTTLVVSSDDQAVLASAELGTPGEDEVLQVWVIDERGAVSAGLFEDPSSPELLDIPVPAGATVGITIEPAGGSDQPTSDPIWATEV